MLTTSKSYCDYPHYKITHLVHDELGEEGMVCTALATALKDEYSVGLRLSNTLVYTTSYFCLNTTVSARSALLGFLEKNTRPQVLELLSNRLIDADVYLLCMQSGIEHIFALDLKRNHLTVESFKTILLHCPNLVLLNLEENKDITVNECKEIVEYATKNKALLSFPIPYPLPLGYTLPPIPTPTPEADEVLGKIAECLESNKKLFEKRYEYLKSSHASMSAIDQNTEQCMRVVINQLIYQSFYCAQYCDEKHKYATDARALETTLQRLLKLRLDKPWHAYTIAKALPRNEHDMSTICYLPTELIQHIFSFIRV